MANTRRVVITGMGIVSPLGNTVEEFGLNLMQGVSGIKRLETDFSDQLEINIAASADFDGTQHLSLIHI